MGEFFGELWDVIAPSFREVVFTTVAFVIGWLGLSKPKDKKWKGD